MRVLHRIRPEASHRRSHGGTVGSFVAGTGGGVEFQRRHPAIRVGAGQVGDPRCLLTEPGRRLLQMGDDRRHLVERFDQTLRDAPQV